MKRKTLLVDLAWLLFGISGGIDMATATAGSALPDNLKVPAGQERVLEAHAVGYQVYGCDAKSDATGFEWTLKGPDAELFDAAGKKIGKHYVGPTWESVDGSKVVGEVKARADAPDGKGIPWLLLAAKSTMGKGVLGDVVSIQRIDTVGGKAPTEGCDQAHVGAEIRVPYTATYHFYTAEPEEPQGQAY